MHLSPTVVLHLDSLHCFTVKGHFIKLNVEVDAQSVVSHFYLIYQVILSETLIVEISTQNLEKMWLKVC